MVLATDFLLEHNFDMQSLFDNGIPYFSREEEALVRDRFSAELKEANFRPINPDPSKPNGRADLESMASVNTTILDWIVEDKVNMLLTFPSRVKTTDGLAGPVS